MKRVLGLVLAVLAGLVSAAVVSGSGRADGLPVLGVDVGATGVASVAGDARYVTLPAGRATVVARVSRLGGKVLASRLLVGSLTIPAVAYDGSAGGLSVDGRTLVLIEPRLSFPRAETRFLVLAAPTLQPLRKIRLRGDFSFDAISPHGALMYLIQYTEPTDPSRYHVRAYNLHTGRLLTKPITDPRERGEKMRGSPITRMTSPDGRFAYTLYDGAGGTPFIHALDTSHGTATCIDLDALTGNQNLWRLRLALDHDGALTVRAGAEIDAIVDTRTYEVTTPGPLITATADSSPAQFPTWLTALAAGAIAVSVLAAAGMVSRRRRRADHHLASS